MTNPVKRSKLKSEVKLSPRSRAIHGEFSSHAWEFTHHLIPPMTASTTFRLDSLKRGAQGFLNFANLEARGSAPIWIYDRLEEPTTLMLEEQLANLEGGDCAISFGSGMGAIASTLLAITKTGQKIVGHRTMYGCTHSLLTQWLPRFGIETELTNINDPSFSNLLNDPKLRVIYFESVANPSLEMMDIQKLCKQVAQANKKRPKDQHILTVVDNTFATPWALRPMELGVDFTIESLTKNISGFGTEMGGAVITSKKYEGLIKLARKDFGAIINPYSAWHILVYGLPTQSVRFEKAQQTAQHVAQFLEKHPKVESVLYPGLKSHPQHALAKRMLRSPEGKFSPGFMLGFSLKGKTSKSRSKSTQRLVDDIAKNSYSITLAVSLGLVKTLIEVPGFMTHSVIPQDKQKETNIDPHLIRMSLGLESEVDIIRDLTTGLAKI
jgi:methionine-gamma-lyase